MKSRFQVGDSSMAQRAIHTTCPRCRESGRDRAGDNLADYGDHKYCFSCGYFEGDGNKLSISRITKQISQQKKNGPRDVALPSDFSFDLPENVREWLAKYAITEEEIELHSLGWTEKYTSLVFPILDVHGNLLMVQSRKFSDSPGPKYFTSGYPESIMHLVGHERFSGTIVVVEDLISAIKVGRHCTTMPLWGSSISTERIHRLSTIAVRLVIWLDNDKAEYATRRAVTAQPWFSDVKVVVTELDPKEYSDKLIRSNLGLETP